MFQRLFDRFPGARRWTDEVTVIGPRVFLEGEIRAPGTVVIAGQVDGPVTSGELVRVAEGGLVRGPIKAVAAVIEGTVEGSITVSERVELRRTARVRGDVTAAEVACADTAQVKGRVRATAGPVGRLVDEPDES